MKKINAPRLPVSRLDRQTYIGDLLYIEGPILSLFRDRKENWFYLWCDTDSEATERWLLFPVTRADVIGYLDQSKTLRATVGGATKHWILDVTHRPDGEEENSLASSRVSHRVLRDIGQAVPEEYLPATDSYFDQSVSPDISLALEVNPSAYEVPIAGSWFFSDLARFSSRYSQLYAFFYCTKPRFITNLGQRVQRYLRSPWKGGFSRVNLFYALEHLVPSLHDLEIKQIRYQSPGEIRIEALKSVGEKIAATVKLFLERELDIVEAEKAINEFLSAKHLKKADLSKRSDSQLRISAANISFLAAQRALIADALNLTAELNEIAAYSPNTVVTAKVVVALVKRVRRLGDFQQSGLIQLA